MTHFDNKQEEALAYKFFVTGAMWTTPQRTTEEINKQFEKVWRFAHCTLCGYRTELGDIRTDHTELISGATRHEQCPSFIKHIVHFDEIEWLFATVKTETEAKELRETIQNTFEQRWMLEKNYPKVPLPDDVELRAVAAARDAIGVGKEHIGVSFRQLYAPSVDSESAYKCSTCKDVCIQIDAMGIAWIAERLDKSTCPDCGKHLFKYSQG